jgi:O-antigen/teichoic acid export membrane protein
MILVNIIVKPLWIFAIDRNVQLVVGNNNYGIYFALLNLTFVFSILLDLGLTINSNRTIAANPEKMITVFTNVLWAKILLSFIYFIVLFICCAVFYADILHFKMLGLLAFLQFLNSFLQFLRSMISANHNFKADSVLSVLDKIIVSIICGIILVTPKLLSAFSVTQFIYFQIFGLLISIIMAWTISRKYMPHLNLKIHVKNIYPLIRLGIPYTFVVLLMGIYTRSDGFLIERLLTDGQVQSGYYASIYRLLDTCNMLGFLFAGMLLPIFARLISNKNNIAQLIGTSVNLLLPLSITIVSFSWFYRDGIMQLLTKEANAHHALAFAILMCSFPALCIMNIYSTALTANNNIKTLIKICGIGAIVSVVLNLIFIPNHGYIAAASICVLVQWLVAVLFLLYSKKILQLPYNFSKLVKLLAFFLIILSANYLLQNLQFSMLLAILINVLLFFGLIWTIRIWDMKIIRQYFSN